MTTRRTRWATLLAGTLAIGGLAACEPAPDPTTFLVNTATDGADASPGDGVCEATGGLGDCTLPAAIEEGNAAGGPIRIDLQAGLADGDVALALTLPTITTTTTIDGHGAHLEPGFVHTAGTLTLRNLTYTNPTADICRLVDSTGDGVVLANVRSSKRASRSTTVCAAGDVAVVESDLEGDGVVVGGNAVVYSSMIGRRMDGPALELTDDGTFTVVNSMVSALDPGSATGIVAYSRVDGPLTTGVTASASVLGCEPGSAITSGGYNLDDDGTCGADHPTDRHRLLHRDRCERLGHRAGAVPAVRAGGRLTVGGGDPRRDARPLRRLVAPRRPTGPAHR